MLADETLTVPERLVLRAASTGENVDLRVGDLDRDNPARGRTWGTSRVVRAALLVELLTGAREVDKNLPRALKVRGVRITGVLNLEAATLVSPLLLQDCHIEQPIDLREAIASSIRLPGCCVSGIVADQLHTSGDLELNNGFTAYGEIRLTGAHIEGKLTLSGGNINNPGGRALAAHGLVVDGPMFCNEGFTAHGEILLVDARIGGLEFYGASLNNSGGDALTAARLTTKGAVFFRDGFTAHGEISLMNAHVGMLSFRQATLVNPGGFALNAIGITVNGHMGCLDGFIARGVVKLFGANIAGELRLQRARFSNPNGLTLDLERVTTPMLYLLPHERPDGWIDFVNARVGNFYDDPATWPVTLRLRGFVYENLEDDKTNVRTRLGWLSRDRDGYRPQPYEQLAKAYSVAGRDDAARQIKIAKEWRRRRELRPLGKAWNWLLYLTVGYGYRTWLAAVWLAGLLALGTSVFSNAYPEHITQSSPSSPTFHAVAYTLDVLLPIVDLGQQKAWTPQGTALYWSWALIAAGWILTTAMVAGLTSILKRG